MASLPVSHDELDFSDALSVTCSFIDPFYYLDYKGTNSRFLAYVRRQGHVVTLVTKKEGLMTSLTDFHPGTLVLCFEVKTIIGLAFCCLSPLTRTRGNIGSEDRRTNGKSERFLILEFSSIVTSSFLSRKLRMDFLFNQVFMFVSVSWSMFVIRRSKSI